MRRTVLLSAVMILALLAGCLTPGNSPGPRTDIDHFGTTLSPRSTKSADLRNYYLEAGAIGDTLAWTGDWFFLSVEGSAPHTVAAQANEWLFQSSIVASFFHPQNGTAILPMNETGVAFHIEIAVQFAKQRHPSYFGLGYQVDRLAQTNRPLYDNFTEWYDVAYTRIKAVSPTTAVFPVFDLEHMSGLRGGLDVGLNASVTREAPSWGLLDDFPNRDLTVFSSFPGIYYRNPSQVPRAHYATLAAQVDGPIAFAEVGWHAGPWPEGWESSMEEQGAFVEQFFRRAPALEFVNWLHLYDQPGSPPYDTMGLLNADRSPRPAWDAWNVHAEPGRPAF